MTVANEISSVSGLDVETRQRLSARARLLLVLGGLAVLVYLGIGVAYALATSVNLAGEPWLVALISFGLEVVAWPVMLGLR